jgi:hypothetical protein
VRKLIVPCKCAEAVVEYACVHTIPFLQLLDSAKKMKFLDVTVKEAVTNALVAVEIGCWFYLGEMIGRRHIIGYSIPNTHH